MFSVSGRCEKWGPIHSPCLTKLRRPHREQVGTGGAKDQTPGNPQTEEKAKVGANIVRSLLYIIIIG